jgi:hypothetical protein
MGGKMLGGMMLEKAAARGARKGNDHSGKRQNQAMNHGWNLEF